MSVFGNLTHDFFILEERLMPRFEISQLSMHILKSTEFEVRKENKCLLATFDFIVYLSANC